MVCITWVLAIIAILIPVLHYMYKKYSHFASINIPYVKPWPFVGNFGRVVLSRQSLTGLISDSYVQFRDYKMYGMYFFLEPVLMVRDPEMVKKICVKDFDHFVDHRPVLGSDVDHLFSENLFSLNGKKWKDSRTLLSPTFTSSKMKGMFVLISEIGDQLRQYLDSELNKQGGGVLEIECRDLFTRYTTDIVATTAFGIKVDSLKNKTNEFYLMGEQAAGFMKARRFIFLGYMFSPKLMQTLGISMLAPRASKFFKSLVKETVTRREKEGIVRPDMIHLLMQARRGELTEDGVEPSATGGHRYDISDDDLAAQAFIFFLAGFDTSSSFLSFATHQLALHPLYQERLHCEIDAVMKEHDGKVSYDAIQNMKYLEMVAQETLRMYPLAPFMDRICVKPYTIPATKDSPEVQLRVGDSVAIPVYGLQHDPEYFPNPEHFDPERFSEENKTSIHQYAFIPFGVGPRICLGNRFALLQAKVALVHILSSFNIKAVPRTPDSRKFSPKSFGPLLEGGFWVGLSRRQVANVP